MSIIVSERSIYKTGQTKAVGRFSVTLDQVVIELKH